MKTTLLILGLMLATTFTFAQNVIRVQNGQSLQTIIDDPAFVAGSVLLLDPGSYGSVIVRKRVSIIGSGYFNGTNEAQLDDVTFASNNLTASDGSLITGCSMRTITISRSNITVQRCRFYPNSSTDDINIGAIDNARLVQCFIDGNVVISGDATNFLIKNCIINGAIYTRNSSVRYTGVIAHNTMTYAACDVISLGTTNVNVTVANNILITPATCNNANAGQNYRTDMFASFNNNIVRLGNYQSTNPSNVFLNVANMAGTLFTPAGTSLEGQYMLSASSPARGAGEGGTDCGAFGGADPYVLTGSPVGPVIQDLQVPATARQNETIQIRLRAKIQN
ncbi:right-handed parallel beta-helix repeat-containing protein [Rudanella lutea]|uniref:right-handed parallel beta-helix repeat-containing protein n=1 Tax=Rudanella lutea TaxID=451374 RepID=UPI00036E269B|nr:right-handed parallel beta-helix repeat-containing protein [Rudanella lutea]